MPFIAKRVVALQAIQHLSHLDPLAGGPPGPFFWDALIVLTRKREESKRVRADRQHWRGWVNAAEQIGLRLARIASNGIEFAREWLGCGSVP